jgi:hypothetical protein
MKLQAGRSVTVVAMTRKVKNKKVASRKSGAWVSIHSGQPAMLQVKSQYPFLPRLSKPDLKMISIQVSFYDFAEDILRGAL